MRRVGKGTGVGGGFPKLCGAIYWHRELPGFIGMAGVVAGLAEGAGRIAVSIPSLTHVSQVLSFD